MRLPCEVLLLLLYAFYQMYLCLLSNLFLLSIKCQYDCCQMQFYTGNLSNESMLT